MIENYRVCSRCIMDNNGDPFITFNARGECNYCTNALKAMTRDDFFNPSKQKQKLEKLLSTIKKDGQSKAYDCLMGISGGLDSAYLAYLGSVKWGLRILAIHIDDGFDAELAVNNINNLCKKCNLNLIKVTPDAEQYADVVKAFISAEVPNVAIPQDNILFALLYQYARKYDIKYFLSGGNYALESILQKGNTYTAYDTYHIRKIHEKFGLIPMSNLQFISSYRKDIDEFLLGIKTVRPLNLIDYKKDIAIKELYEFCGFQYYKAKHLENRLTKVIQLKWLVDKFGVDKRKSHLSSMIVSGQLTREQAMREMEKELYDKKEMEVDVDYVLNKLNFSKNKFAMLLRTKGKSHLDYPHDRVYYIYRYLIAVLFICNSLFSIFKKK